MDFVQKRKDHIRWAIEQNPTKITVNRTEKTRSGGGFEENSPALDSIVVRIYTKSSASSKEISDLAGTKQRDVTWSMLADYNADIKAGPNVTDEFDVPGFGHFVIQSVRPQIVKGTIVGYQADLERVI
jgi:hypothetical protein